MRERKSRKGYKRGIGTTHKAGGGSNDPETELVQWAEELKAKGFLGRLDDSIAWWVLSRLNLRGESSSADTEDVVRVFLTIFPPSPLHHHGKWIHL